MEARRRDGRRLISLGAIKFDGDTGYYFRKTVLLPFVNQYLKDGAPKVDEPAVLAYETGANEWRHYESWPPKAATPTPLYLHAGAGAGLRQARAPGFMPPPGAASDDYVSDPAKPVPYRLRPIRPTYSEGSTWGQWLVDDQRLFSDGRTC